MPSNSGWFFVENRRSGFTFEQCEIGGRCSCSRVVPCSSGDARLCTRARQCEDTDGLNRCVIDVQCTESADEETFSNEATLYASCENAPLTTRSNGEVRDFGEALKAAITQTCGRSDFQVRAGSKEEGGGRMEGSGKEGADPPSSMRSRLQPHSFLSPATTRQSGGTFARPRLPSPSQFRLMWTAPR